MDLWVLLYGLTFTIPQAPFIEATRSANVREIVYFKLWAAIKTDRKQLLYASERKTRIIKVTYRRELRLWSINS